MDRDEGGMKPCVQEKGFNATTNELEEETKNRFTSDNGDAAATAAVTIQRAIVISHAALSSFVSVCRRLRFWTSVSEERRFSSSAMSSSSYSSLSMPHPTYNPTVEVDSHFSETSS